MSLNVSKIQELVVEELSRRETRLLSLIVAVRRNMVESGGFKGDLGASVKSVLRTLVASHRVIDTEGIYSLATPVGEPVGN